MRVAVPRVVWFIGSLWSATFSEAACFTAERQEEVASASPSSPTTELSSGATDASEQAFLAAAQSIEGVTGDADALLEAGQTVCVVARDLHTLESLLATLTVDRLAAFSIVSVVSLCPEVDDT